MTNEPSIVIFYAPQFKRDLKDLRKKYPKVGHDVNNLIKQLQLGETPGNQVRGVGYTAYKVRVRSSDLSKGKSSGYRVIYYIKTPQSIILITIYIKAEQTDIDADDIRRLIDDLK